MRREIVLPLILATFVLAAIFVIAPKSTIVAFEGSAEMYGDNIVEPITSATNLPERR